jgi:hypothetical protein
VIHPGIKYPSEKKASMKKVRNENLIIPSSGCLSCRGSSAVRVQSLKRGQLSSFSYSTWLSLPFQWFLVRRGFCHLLFFWRYRDIRFVTVRGIFMILQDVFVDGRWETRRGIWGQEAGYRRDRLAFLLLGFLNCKNKSGSQRTSTRSLDS